MVRIFLIFLVLVIASPGAAFRLPIRMYRNADGLPQEQVRAIAQDSKGRIYIGTVGGVGVYNGREFARLGVRQGLPAEDIYSLAVDGEDRVWIGTPYGLAVLEQGTVTTVSFPEYVGKTIVRVQVGDGVYFQNREGVYRLKDGEFSYLSSGKVESFALGPDGTLYIASPGQLLIRRGGADTVVPLPAVETVSVLSLRRDGSLLIGARNGLFHFNGSGVRPLLEGVPLTDCMEDEEGDLWLSSEIGGLHHFQRGAWNRYAFVGDTRLNQAYCVFEDRERNIWFGTVSGMGKIPYRQFGIYEMQDGLPEYLPSCIYEDPQGRLHVGFLGSTVAYDRGTDRFVTESPPLPPDATVRAMGTDPKGRLVLGTADHGLFIREGGRLTAVSAVAGFGVSRVFDMLEDPERGLWIATRAGLILFDGESYRLFTSAQGLPSNTCYGLGIDRDGRVLVCTQRGIAVFDGTAFAVPPALHGVTCEVNVILPAADGTLWIGTHGFGLMELRGETLSVHDETKGFPNDFVWGIAEDGQGTLWVASNKGIHRRQEGRWLTFNSRDGFPGDEIFIHTAKADHQGDLWFGFPFGMVRVFAGRDRPNAVLPGLQVDRIVTLRGAHPVTSAALEFEPSDRDLLFEYTAYSYQNEEQVYYRTRLEPIEEEWSEPTRLNALHYPRLGPGLYRFQVLGCNNSLLWTTEPAGVEFRILPFFHETWWFRGLLVLAVLLLVAGGLLWRLRAVTRAKIKLERLVQERTEELKGKVEIIESLSRTDPLTNVYNRRYFVDRFEQVVAFSKRYDEPFCFVIIDIDNFKDINDTRGHLVGDRILVEFSKLLVEGFRETDLLARYGGDEFVVLMQKAEPQGVRTRVEMFLQTLRDHDFAGDTQVKLTFSAGIAYIWPKAIEHITFDWVAGTADRFMYEAKRAGKNCVLFKEIKAS